jgi:hypothetical protein
MTMLLLMITIRDAVDCLQELMFLTILCYSKHHVEMILLINVGNIFLIPHDSIGLPWTFVLIGCEKFIDEDGNVAKTPLVQHSLSNILLTIVHVLLFC